jgi:hypothetical protein
MIKYTEQRYPIVLPAEVIEDSSLIGKLLNRKTILPAVYSHNRITRIYHLLGEDKEFHINVEVHGMPNLEEYLDHHFKRAVAKYMDSA